MVATSTSEVPSKTNSEYDGPSEVKAFDETKDGVKGLVDGGIAQILRIPPNDINSNSVCNDTQLIIPVIDLGDLFKDSVKRKEIVERVGEASETWGFFQVVNHGIPVSVMVEMKDGTRRFFEQDPAVKKEFYTRDVTRKIAYNSNFDLYTSTAAKWRDTFFSYMAPFPPHLEELPEACRYIYNYIYTYIFCTGIECFQYNQKTGRSQDHGFYFIFQGNGSSVSFQ